MSTTVVPGEEVSAVEGGELVAAAGSEGESEVEIETIRLLSGSEKWTADSDVTAGTTDSSADEEEANTTPRYSLY